MRIGLIGLGKMGGNMANRLVLHKHEVVAYARKEESRARVRKFGAETAESIESMVEKLPEKKIVWLMVPAGEATESTIEKLKKLLKEGDIIVDGGNSFYKDSMRRSELLREKGIHFLDCGTSGGIWGLEKGYCMMIGGFREAFYYVKPVLKSLAPEDGYQYIGASGSGHFVKMIHNGIEYGMLQAYAEGFELIKNKREFDVDLHDVSKLWNHGSVVRSWLLELAEDMFDGNKELEGIKGFVEDSGEGRWTVLESILQGIPAPVITESIFARFRSRQDSSFASKVIAGLRNQFGGHKIKKVKDE
jgi:6-phosphogluconate dehydrogenase